MKEKTRCEFEKKLFFKSGEEIIISVELININPKKYENIKDFLETMFKEIKELF